MVLSLPHNRSTQGCGNQQYLQWFTGYSHILNQLVYSFHTVAWGVVGDNLEGITPWQGHFFNRNRSAGPKHGRPLLSCRKICPTPCVVPFRRTCWPDKNSHSKRSRPAIRGPEAGWGPRQCKTMQVGPVSVNAARIGAMRRFEDGLAGSWFFKKHRSNWADGINKIITLLRVIPTMTFQSCVLIP